MVDVLIIGAGVVGLSIARQLARYKLRIAVVEKEADVAMGATKANSAIVHGGFAESHLTLKGQLCYKGRRQFAEMEKQLHFGFQAIGSLVMTTDADDLPELKRLLVNGRQNGLPDLEILGREQVLALEPNINPDVAYALHCRGAGICSPYGLAIALAENAVANGVDLLLNQPVIQIKVHNDNRPGRFQVSTPDHNLESRYLINCSGLAAEDISKNLYLPSWHIRPRTGEYLLFQRGSGSLIKTVIFQMPTPLGKGVLVTPTVHDNLILGPDAIDEDGVADCSTHVDRLAAIYRQALRTTGKLDLNQMIRSYSGVRAAASTNDFIIEMSPVAGFIEVSGIQSPGLTASPAIAGRVEAILADAGLKLTANPDFTARRAVSEIKKEWLPMADVVRQANQPDGPQRIICRCEQVRQQTIENCLEHGLPVQTIDAVKRRTRAGMGICQGAFCRPRVIAMLRQSGQLLDEMTDAERHGLQRVSRRQLLDYISQTEQS